MKKHKIKAIEPKLTANDFYTDDLYKIESALEGALETIRFLTGGISVTSIEESLAIVRDRIDERWKRGRK